MLQTEKGYFFVVVVQLRVSSEISKAPFILLLDCDMSANNADSIREALCFFLDGKYGHEIAFVQHPQNYNNLTKDDIYGSGCFVINAVRNTDCSCNFAFTFKLLVKGT